MRKKILAQHQAHSNSTDNRASNSTISSSSISEQESDEFKKGDNMQGGQ